jgi:hypothetical protein
MEGSGKPGSLTILYPSNRRKGGSGCFEEEKNI